jgi:DNA polymerase III subunit epsilon
MTSLKELKRLLKQKTNNNTMSQKRAIYYDTETTGVRPDKDRIIELAAYDPVNDRSFVQFINPGCPIPPDASAIHHITDEMVASAPDFGTVIKEFIDFCSGDVVLIAHNNDSFDQQFLHHEFQRCSQQMPSWLFMDSLKWSRRYRRDLPRHSLQFLREMYGIEANQAHRALDDVIVLHKVFTLMIDDLSIDEAFSLLNAPKPIQHMPFGKHQGQPLKKLPGDYVKWLAGSGALDKPDNIELKQALLNAGFAI